MNKEKFRNYEENKGQETDNFIVPDRHNRCAIVGSYDDLVYSRQGSGVARGGVGGGDIIRGKELLNRFDSVASTDKNKKKKTKGKKKVHRVHDELKQRGIRGYKTRNHRRENDIDNRICDYDYEEERNTNQRSRGGNGKQQGGKNPSHKKSNTWRKLGSCKKIAFINGRLVHPEFSSISFSKLYEYIPRKTILKALNTYISKQKCR